MEELFSTFTLYKFVIYLSDIPKLKNAFGLCYTTQGIFREDKTNTHKHILKFIEEVLLARPY